MASAQLRAAAESLLAAGKSAEAIAGFRGALRADPRDATAWHFLAFALASNGRQAEAEAQFVSLLKLTPSDATAYFNLGNAQREQPGGDQRAEEPRQNSE